MVTASTKATRYTELKARVAALGHQMFTDDCDTDGGKVGVYVLDPKAGKTVFTEPDGDEAEAELIAWRVDGETDAADAAAVTAAPAASATGSEDVRPRDRDVFTAETAADHRAVRQGERDSPAMPRRAAIEHGARDRKSPAG